MRIAVFGAGGVGGYFGARLAQAGEDVVFIARGEHLRAMLSNGLRVESPKGDVTVSPVAATDNPAEAGPVDCVLLAVKAWQVEEAARALGPLLGPETFIVPLENGIEAPEQLSRVLGGSERVLGGLCAIISYIEAPGVIRHIGVDPRVYFGELDNQQSDRALQLLEAFRRAPGVEPEIPADIHVAMWRKFLFIAGWGGTAAAARVEAGMLRCSPETSTLIRRCMSEIAEVARAAGIALPDDAVDTAFVAFESMPADATASMQRDIESGRPSELDNQLGAVVRLGRRYGVETPCNEVLYSVLLPREQRARSE